MALIGILAKIVYKGLMCIQERKYERLMHLDPETYLRELFTNPVILAQAISELIICPHWELGHSLPHGKDFLGENNYQSIDEIVHQVSDRGSSIILNIGDSSTSGWDGTVVSVNRLKYSRGENEVLAPFFRYKTYSDILRERLEGSYPGHFEVVNAGVPAHSSLQGLRRLEIILERFAKEKCPIHTVTLYFGNNDCAWNGGLADRDLLPEGRERYSEWQRAAFMSSCYAKVKYSRKFRERATQRVRSASTISRVGTLEFKQNLRSMIRTCRKWGIRPIIIEPVIPYYWRPGTRVHCENLSLGKFRRTAAGKQIVESLNSALALWDVGTKQIAEDGHTSNSEKFLSMACEQDWILPRIKAAHRRQLSLVSLEENCPLMQIQIPREQDDGRLFADYCHPIGDANMWIAKEIQRQIEIGNNDGRLVSDSIAYPGRYKLYDKVAKPPGNRERTGTSQITEHIPSDIYTLQ